MDGATFFGRLTDLLKHNPPAEADGPMVDKLARLGSRLVSSTHGTRSRSTTERSRLAEDSRGNTEAARESRQWMDVMGNIGRYGTNISSGPSSPWSDWANLPEDAIYPHAKIDSDGIRSRERTATWSIFPRRAPTGQCVWSLTM